MKHENNSFGFCILWDWISVGLETDRFAVFKDLEMNKVILGEDMMALRIGGSIFLFLLSFFNPSLFLLTAEIPVL